MKDLAGLTKENVQELIDRNILTGWDDYRIIFPCLYSDDACHYMIAFDTSDEQFAAYEILFKPDNSLLQELRGLSHRNMILKTLKEEKV